MKKFLKVLITTLLLLGLALSMVACGETADPTKSAEKGLKYKKDAKTGFYTVYGYVQEDNVTELDLSNVKDANGNAIVIGKIATGAFRGNDALKKVIVPDTVTEISAGAFKNMNKLEELVLPFIGKTANSDAIMNEYHPEGENEEIEKSVNIERTFVYIFGTDSYDKGASVTANYGASTANYYIPAYFKKVVVKNSEPYSIPMYAFSGVNLIREVELCDTIDAIGDNAFSNCHDLTKVNIPASVKNIYNEAFKGSVNFGANLTEQDNANIALATLGTDVFVGTKLDK